MNTRWLLLLLFILFPLSAAKAQDEAAQANNPLADLTALNFQNYYIGGVEGYSEDAYQFIVRYAQPFTVGDSLWLLRASLPVNDFPGPPAGRKTAGMGDLNVFASYLFPLEDPAVSFGFGPQITAPTASDNRVGSEKWSAGFANVLFDGRDEKFQYGYLLTWQGSFAGDEARNDVSLGAFQPFAFYQLGDGYYLRTASIWTYNFDNDHYAIPLGLGLGKVIRKNNVVYNFFVEPQYSVWRRGTGQPEWQIYFSLNLQFLKGGDVEAVGGKGK